MLFSEELRDKDLFWTEDHAGTKLVIDSKIVEYSKGNAFNVLCERLPKPRFRK